MPIEIRDLDGGIGNIILGSGVLTGEEYKNAIKTHLSQDRVKFKKYRYCLSDYTEVAKVDVPSSDIELVARLCKEAAVVNPEAVVANVAEKDIAFGLSRMWEILIDETNWEVMVFRKRGDAEAWIKEKVKEKYGIVDLTFG